MAIPLAIAVVGLALAAAPAGSPPRTSSARWSMAVLPLADRGVGKDLAELISETVTQEAQKLDGPRVVGMNEVKSLLGFEAQKQMLGCTESGCMAEIAGALGVDKALTGWVGKVGDSWLLTLKVINVRTTAVEAQASERVLGGTGEAYLDLVGPMIAQLFPSVPLKPGQVRGVGSKTGSSPPVVSRTWAWAAAGTAVAAAGVGVAFGLSASSAEAKYDDLVAKSATEPVSWSEIEDAADTATSRAKAANVFYVTAGVAGVTSLVLFYLSSGEEKRASATGPVVSIVPVPGGAFAAIGGRY